MASCSVCGATIIFGGKKSGDYRFCNDNCYSKGQVLIVSDQIPHDIVETETRNIHQGNCPKCGKDGPVDVHFSYSVWSAAVLTSWKSKVHICCKSCGVKAQAIDLAGSAVLGWWGVPWGFIMTPVQITRNIIGMVKNNTGEPSDNLRKQVKMHMAAYHLENSKHNS